jgi:hypothetical protein
MGLFDFLKGKWTGLSAPSPASRVVSSNGEPAVVSIQSSPLVTPTEAHQDLDVAVAIVLQDVESEGFNVRFHHADIEKQLDPNIVGALNGKEIHIYVAAARAPDMPRLHPTAKGTALVLAGKQNAVAYFAPVGLMEAGGDGEFFVNYRGCYPL